MSDISSYITRLNNYCRQYSLCEIFIKAGLHNIAFYGLKDPQIIECVRRSLSHHRLSLAFLEKNAQSSSQFDIKNIAQYYDIFIISDTEILKTEGINYQHCQILKFEEFIECIEEALYYSKIYAHLKSRGAVMHVINNNYILQNIKNPSPYEVISMTQSCEWDYYVENKKFLYFFYNDLPECSVEYINEIYSDIIPQNIQKRDCIYAADYKSKYINIINSQRYTTDIPNIYSNSIYCFGPCWTFGFATEDKYTIESQLQRKLNKTPIAGVSFRVVNCGAWAPFINAFKRVLEIEYNPGDVAIVVCEPSRSFLWYHSDNDIITFHNDLWKTFCRPHDYGEIFFDTMHVNHRGYDLTARYLHDLLAKTYTPSPVQRQQVFSKILEQGARIPNDSAPLSPELTKFISGLKPETSGASGKIGSIVMNCNPFTLGHRYLIEEASRHCDFLYIFVVEEDKSFFPFTDRLAMVKNGIQDIKNIKVLPGGRFILSNVTLPEYFSKDQLPYVTIDASADLGIFAEHIAPALHISVRFAGTEPLCPITKQYNQAMSELLPKFDIDFVTFDRKESKYGPISASKVRELIQSGDIKKIFDLIPKSTYEYLLKRGIICKNTLIQKFLKKIYNKQN